MYRSSARLVAFLCHKYKIPADRQHIIGHNEIPDPNNSGQYGGTGHHQDPGPYWNWIKYMSYVRGYSAQYSGAWSQTVDNSSSNFSASGNWTINTWNSLRYGTNYAYNTPKKVSDYASYKFSVPSKARYKVYAWWPADKGYNSHVPVRIRPPWGWNVVWADQTRNGGKWNYIGTVTMSGGTQTKIEVSRWTWTKGYITADAFKLVKAS